MWPAPLNEASARCARARPIPIIICASTSAVSPLGVALNQTKANGRPKRWKRRRVALSSSLINFLRRRRRQAQRSPTTPLD